ncbi:MAG: dTDP-4-dehydrorhamnose 3,5-epimerase [Paracoccaceae bacterium]
MDIKGTKIPGVLAVHPKLSSDDRRFFSESFSKRTLEQIGIKCDFVQNNHSFSKKVGTLRGLNFHYPLFAQAKLVWCGRDAFLDAVVDIRVGSPTFGYWVSEELIFENGKQLFVPEGFLHGFVVKVIETEITYNCNNYYSPEHKDVVDFNDREINIDWGLDLEVVITPSKDGISKSFLDIISPFEFEVKE